LFIRDKNDEGEYFMPIYYIPVLVMFLVIFIILRNKKFIILKKIIKKRKTKETTKMVELAKQFIGKDCLVYSYDGHQLEGVIKEVGSGAILLERNGELEAVNLDFVMRIREYPKNKKGKKKSVVLD
jgi:hypothetical protein